MIYDLHAHSVNSDGFGTVDELCGFAIEKGVAGFAVTDHADMEYYEERDTYNRIKKSIADVLEAREKYKGKLEIFTGIELGGASGVLAGPDYRLEIHHPDEWTEGMVLSAAIGQSDNTSSPLQLACYLSTIVNGGSRYSAHLLNSVYTFASPTPTFSYSQGNDTILDKIEIPEQVLSTVLLGMREVVTGNKTVSTYLSRVPVTVGGKTGTAQNSSGCENALFVCAAPYDNPEIVISVVLEQGYSGGNASLTTARILEEYYGVSK